MPELRPPRLDEASAIAALSTQLGYPADATDIASRLERVLADPEHYLLVAVDDGGRVTGWVHAAEEFPLEYGPRAEILGLVVDETARGTGVGRNLVEAVERWAQGRGLDMVTVRSNVVRESSHPFYEHLGYKRVKTSHVYEKKWDD